MKISTKLVHTGMEDHGHAHFGASGVPIYQVSTFAQNHPGEPVPYDYARSGNPTREALETAMAELEGGSTGLAFASGIAALSSALLLFQPGDHLIAPVDVYGGTYRILTNLFKRWKLDVTFCDMTDPGNLARSLRPNTRGILVETPSNPHLRITDLAAAADFAREHGLLSLIDNTFMTPLLQRPIEHGFDIVIHSATKFLGGHSDVLAGLAVTRDEATGRHLKAIQVSFGAVLAPQDSWLVLRGIRTLKVRLEAQQATALQMALWLQQHPRIKQVWYPALDGHPGRATHFRQATGGGAVVSFELHDAQDAKALLRGVQLALPAVSLGGVESILSHPATMSHAAMPPDERAARGITDALLRLSVGLEDFEDLTADFNRALNHR